MISISVTLEFLEEEMPQIARLYHACLREDGTLDDAAFGRNIVKHLEASLDQEEQVETLQAQVDAYHEYVYELQNRLELLEPIHANIKHLLEDVRELKQARQPEETEQEDAAPKKHARPSMAIRALRRIQDRETHDDNAAIKADD